MDGIDTGVSAASVGAVRTATASATRTAAPAAGTADSATAQAANSGANLISLLADAAPPIDDRKVEAIQSLIASGRYPIDAHAIAQRMVALDVPGQD